MIKKVLVISGAVIIVILLIVIVSSLSPKNTAESVGGKFVNYVLSGNASAGYSLTDSSFKQATTLATFKTTVGTIDSACIGTPSVKSDDSRGNYSNLLFGINGREACGIQVELQKINNQWQVNYSDEY